MLLYNNALKAYSRLFIPIEKWLIKMVVYFNVDAHLKAIQEAREVAMAKNLTLLISNIKECKTGQHLKNCKDLYQLLCLQYPEFPIQYSKLIGHCLEKQEEIIINQFN